MNAISYGLNILYVALGLGFVIFFHELGHFLVAKWNGVLVEKFSIGFGPALLRFRGKETQYVLAAFPLGGFVKMLGESPEEDAQTTDDPRAYLHKPVGARMAIIAAGPVMNIVLGLVCFCWAYGWGGLLETPARLGLVVAGLPAYQAGIRTGDEVVAIDGRRGVTFDDLLRTVALSGSGQVVRMELKRPGQEAPVVVNIEPRREAKAERPSIGVNPSLGLEVESDRPFVPPPGITETPALAMKGFKSGDKVVQVIPPGEPAQEVTDSSALDVLLARYAGVSLGFVVERGTEGKRERATITVPPARFVDFGFRLTIEPLAAVQGGSIAEQAGFLKGDVIHAVDGAADFDPMRLPTYCYEHAGKPVVFEIERPASGGPAKTTSLTVTPDLTPAWTELVLPSEPLEVPGIGIAYRVSTRIVSVKDGSPAARAGLKPGTVIKSMAIRFTVPDKKDIKPVTFKFDGGEGWPYAFFRLNAPGEFPIPPEATIDRAVELTTDQSAKPIALVPEPDPTWYCPLRGLRFEYLKTPLPPRDFTGALRRGGRETVEQVMAIYYMLRGLAQQRLSEKNFAGPIRIVGLAFSFASAGLAPFLYFLGMLSVNLAVLNFLPIPPLDGGQMAFLLAERVRGRPVPETAQAAGTYAGLLLVLGLMVLFLYQDVLSFFP